MQPKSRLEILRSVPRGPHLPALDAFHEDHVQRDLARLASAPGILAKYVERARTRIQKAGERSILGHWTNLYLSGQQVIAARNEMERKKSEFLQLGHEHEIKAMEKQANLARLGADIEEQNLRREKAMAERQQLHAPPPRPEERLSPEQERARKKAACDARIAALRKDQKEALEAIPAELEEHRRKVSNMYADAIDREMETLRRLL